jgi:hypothetical protein
MQNPGMYPNAGVLGFGRMAFLATCIIGILGSFPPRKAAAAAVLKSGS